MAKTKISGFHTISARQDDPTKSFTIDQVKAAFLAGVKATEDIAAKSAYVKDHPVCGECASQRRSCEGVSSNNVSCDLCVKGKGKLCPRYEDYIRLYVLKQLEEVYPALPAVDAEALYNHVIVLRLGLVVVPVVSAGETTAQGGVAGTDEGGSTEVGEKRRRGESGKGGRKGKRMRGGGGEDVDLESSLIRESTSTTLPRLSIRVRRPTKKAKMADSVSSRRARKGKGKEREREKENDGDAEEDTGGVVLVELDMGHDDLWQQGSRSEDEVEMEVDMASDSEDDPLPDVTDDTPPHVMKDIIQKQQLQLASLTRQLKDLKKGHAVRAEHYHALLRPLREFRSSSSLDGLPPGVEADIEKPWELGLSDIEKYTHETIQAVCTAAVSDARLHISRAKQGPGGVCRSQGSQIEDVPQQPPVQEVADRIRATCAAFGGGVSSDVQRALCRTVQRMRVGWLEEMVDATQRDKLAKIREGYRDQVQEAQGRTRRHVGMLIDLNEKMKKELVDEYEAKRDADQRDIAILAEHRINELQEQLHITKAQIYTPNNPDESSRTKYYADFTLKTHLHILHASSFLDPLKSHHDDEVRRCSTMAAHVLGEAAGGYVRCMKPDVVRGVAPFVSFEDFVGGGEGGMNGNGNGNGVNGNGVGDWDMLPMNGGDVDLSITYRM